MRSLTMFVFLLAGSTACHRAPTLETRTFALQYIEPRTAEELIQPYVYADRAQASGTMSVTDNTVTVRETADNLERIARVLAQYDVPSPWVRLHFQIIEADGPGQSDERIQALEGELRELFRYEGYRLVAEAVMSGAARSHVEQVIGAGGRAAERYMLGVDIGAIRSIGDSGFVSLDVTLQSRERGALQTRINARTGQTIVLGNAQLSSAAGTTILAVRAEFVNR